MNPPCSHVAGGQEDKTGMICACSVVKRDTVQKFFHIFYVSLSFSQGYVQISEVSAGSFRGLSFT